MRRCYNIVLVTIFVLTYNHANGDDREDRKLQKLRDQAANCEVGSRIKSDRCNWCSCEAKGVMLCSRVMCSMDDPDDDNEQEDNKDDQELDNDLDIDMAPESNTEDEYEDDDIETYKKLRNIAVRCEVGKKMQRGCISCVCAIPGVMSCEKISGCVGPRPNKKS